MLGHWFDTFLSERGDRRLLPRGRINDRAILGVLATTMVLVAAVTWGSDGAPIRGETDQGPGQSDSLKPAPAASQSDFLAESHRKLKTLHERMIELANRPSGARVEPGTLADQLLNQQITTETARSAHRNATLTREVAEIAVMEYTEGVFRQDEATLKGELGLAQSNVNIQTTGIDVAKERLANALRASNGSAIDLSIVFRYADRVADFERRERKARLEVEKVESRLRMLAEYTKPITVRQLQGEVAMARADELAKKAILELETAKEKRLRAAAVAAGAIGTRNAPRLASLLGRPTRPAPPDDEDRTLAVLEKAIAVEEQIRIMLSQVTTEGRVAAKFQNEVGELIGRVQAIVEEAEGERSAVEIGRLKARIHQAVSQGVGEK